MSFKYGKQHLFINGEIITVNAYNDVVEFIAVKGNKILEVGSKNNILTLKGDYSKVIDLNGLTFILHQRS